MELEPRASQRILGRTGLNVTQLGYGPPDWKCGGRLITLDLQAPKPFPAHREVF